MTKSNHFWYMSKDKAINVLRNADLTEKNWNIIKHENLLLHIKNAESNCNIW